LLRKASDSGSANTSIWDLTGPRDLAICGFYVRSLHGPSYLQRLTQQIPYGLNFQNGFSYSAGYGIESFVVGRWAGGADDPNAAQDASDPDGARARVDYLFYQGPDNAPTCEGAFDKGMPGCKNIQMCEDLQSPATLQSPGRFALTYTPTDTSDRDPTERYGFNSTIENLPYRGGACR
jgi:hypothetical protein